MCTCVPAHACVCMCACCDESAHTAFLILENQKQIIGKEKTQAVLSINWAQMEAGNKRTVEKTLGEKNTSGRTVRDRGGTRESDRARARQGEDVTEKKKWEGRGERVRKRTGMMWRN